MASDKEQQEPSGLGVALKVILGMQLYVILIAALVLLMIGALFVPPGIIRIICGLLFFSLPAFILSYFVYSGQKKSFRLLSSVLFALFFGLQYCSESIKAISGVVAYRICSGIAAVLCIVLIIILLRNEWKSKKDHTKLPAQ